MLEIQRIRNQKDQVIEGLKKRGISTEDNIQRILSIDEDRKKTQKILDGVLNQSKITAKQIGTLIRNGETEKAAEVKLKLPNSRSRLGN